MISGEPAPYPLVSTAGDEGFGRHVPAPEDNGRRVEFELAVSPGMRIPDELLARARDYAGGGARVALICNLVKDAQETARRLRASSGVPVDLFHSRYRFVDRQAIEEGVLGLYGPGRTGGEGRILVATQVVEQSLDLDFDWMTAQLCPADLLFQRVGRLHRHDRERPPGLGEPRCAVVAPAGDDFGAHEHIYGDARALWRTRALIENESRPRFPAAYRDWIEAVYDEGRRAGEPDLIARKHEDFKLKMDAARIAALGLVNGGMSSYNDTDGNVTVLTRDGEMSLSVVPVLAGEERRFLSGEAFSAVAPVDLTERLNMETIPVPNSWTRHLPAPESDRLRYLPMVLVSEGCWRSEDGTWTYGAASGLERGRA